MKKNLLYLTLVCALLSIKSVSATDLIVAPGGTGGAYSSIGLALTAANPGDRIIVYPKASGATYAEGVLTINKSIQILSAQEGAFYAVDGSFIIAPSTPGMSVTIMQMKLFSGTVSANAHAPAGARCQVNLINDSMMYAASYMDFGFNNYDLTLANSVSQHSVLARYGKFIGNKITASTETNINITSESTANTDTVLIIGNKLINGGTSYLYGAIYWNSTSSFFQIYNNFIDLTYMVAAYAVNGIYINTTRASGVSTNYIVNNTIRKAGGYFYYGVYCAPAGVVSKVDIENNMVYSTGVNAYSIYAAGGTTNIHYNLGSSNSWVGFSNDGTNTSLTNTTVDPDGVITNPLSNAINGGSPDSAMADIDLTRNDCGAYGGSFTLNNFFPNGANDWSRVFLVMAPRRVLVNGTIQVKAFGYDK